MDKLTFKTKVKAICFDNLLENKIKEEYKIDHDDFSIYVEDVNIVWDFELLFETKGNIKGFKTSCPNQKIEISGTIEIDEDDFNVRKIPFRREIEIKNVDCQFYKNQNHYDHDVSDGFTITELNFFPYDITAYEDKFSLSFDF